MIKSLMREATLAVQSKTGATSGVFIWLGLAAVAAITAFAFLCVAAYVWLASLYGNVYGGLIAAGFFILIAVIAVLAAALARRRARERAILERAAHAHAGSWLLDPRILAAAMQVGRSLGWQRVVPIALLGFLAAQWAREHRNQRSDSESAGNE
jgi:Ca2+/Na+ antiporter